MPDSIKQTIVTCGECNKTIQTNSDHTPVITDDEITCSDCVVYLRDQRRDTEKLGAVMGCDGIDHNGNPERRIWNDQTPDGVGNVRIECWGDHIEILIDDLSLERVKAVFAALGMTRFLKP